MNYSSPFILKQCEQRCKLQAQGIEMLQLHVNVSQDSRLSVNSAALLTSDRSPPLS